MRSVALATGLLVGASLALSWSCVERDRTLLDEGRELQADRVGRGSSGDEVPPAASDTPVPPMPGADAGGLTVLEPPAALADASTGTASDDTSLAQPKAPPLYPADWCARAGEDTLYQEDTAYEIVDLFVLDPRMLALPPSVDVPEFDVWYDYLVEYTNALLGCPPLYVESFDVAQQGFGLRNTSVAGVPELRLDAVLATEVIDVYVQAVTALIALSAAEADALWMYLWQLAVADACYSETAVGLLCAGADAGSP